MHIYSAATYSRALRSAPSNLWKYAPPGMAWPSLRPPTAAAADADDAGQRLLDASRGAAALRVWLGDLPWHLLGQPDGRQPHDWTQERHPRSVLLCHLRHLSAHSDAAVRSLASWCLDLLTADDGTPATATWHLWDALCAADAGGGGAPAPQPPRGPRPPGFAAAPPPREAPEALPDFVFPQATGPRLSTDDTTPLPCHLVATSLFVHVPGMEVAVNSSLANLAEADVILHILIQHGPLWLRRDYTIRVLAAYAGQVALIRQALELHSSYADGPARADAQLLLGIPVQTVDGAQGAESDIVLASLVRANSKGDTGFVADARRSNVMLSRAKVAQITVGHAPTLGNSAWNDCSGLLDIFDEVGGTYCNLPDGNWEPSTRQRLLDMRQTPPTRHHTRRLSDALALVRSEKRRRGEPADDPLAQKRGRLCARLAGCENNLTRDRQAALQAEGGDPTDEDEVHDAEGGWVSPYLTRAPQVTAASYRAQAIAAALQAVMGIMSSPAFPPILQHLASLRLRPTIDTNGLAPLQYDLKTLSHQGHFGVQGLGTDPGNEVLATGWSVLCCAAGIDLPLGRHWPEGRQDWAHPRPLTDASRHCSGHPAPFSSLAQVPGALDAAGGRGREDLCLRRWGERKTGHLSAFLVRYLCAQQERIIFPPTTLDHLSDAGDILEAVVAVLKPWNANLSSLPLAFGHRYQLDQPCRQALFDHVATLLSSCKHLLWISRHCRLAALTSGDDPEEALLPLGPAGTHLTDRSASRIGPQDDALQPHARLDLPLRWLRTGLQSTGTLWVAGADHGCCFCAALLDAPAPPEPPEPPLRSRSPAHVPGDRAATAGPGADTGAAAPPAPAPPEALARGRSPEPTGRTERGGAQVSLTESSESPPPNCLLLQARRTVA